MKISELKYKTRGITTAQGKPRVYFCCHPEDLHDYFETISNEILELQNCSVWYADREAERGEEFFEDLAQMQLFVMPVTTKLLCTDNVALGQEFPFAMKHHIPVLPLMQEGGLDKLFNHKCGELQFLDKHHTDATAIHYTEKLKGYLESVLIGDELASRIRSAFGSYAFLSYRKKDRRYARELMGLIHQNDFCRDMAIWYDEFLTPGENFNDSISEALKKSRLFVLTVTPNIVNEPNYIMSTEYPMARQQGKPVLPVELVPTDRGQLAEKYEDIPDLADAYDPTGLSRALLDMLKKDAIKESDDSPEHRYLMGLAYLGGVDVEVNDERAVSLITSAAEAGFPDAMEKLIDLYQTGTGVALDYDKAVLWQMKLYECLKARLDPETAAEEDLKRYGNVSLGLSYHLKKRGFGDRAIAIQKEYYDFYESYVITNCKENPRALAEAYDEISQFYSDINAGEDAKVYARKAFSCYASQIRGCDQNIVWLLTRAARRILRLCDGEEMTNMLVTLQGAVEYVEWHVQASEQWTETECFEILSDLYRDYAEILRDAKQNEEAGEYYEKACSLAIGKIDFGRAVDRRLIERLTGALHGLKNLKRSEGNERAAKAYALQMIDVLGRYIDSLVRFESASLRTMRMISAQYSEIAQQYQYVNHGLDDVGHAFAELHYAEKHCEYLEKRTAHGLTVESAKLLDTAYGDVLSVYRMKERASLALSDEEKRHKVLTVRKRIQNLRFMYEQYGKEPRTISVLRRMKDMLTRLIEAHLLLCDTDAAMHDSEEKLRLMLDCYDKTKFLSDAYFAYYDMSDFYKKTEQHDKAAEYFLLGLAYEERELLGRNSREDREQLAYLYRRASQYCLKAGMLEEGNAYLEKYARIKG